MSRWYPFLAEQVLYGLYAKIRPSLSKFFEGAGHLPDWDVLLMQTAYGLEPAPLLPSLLIERIPYTRPESFLERMMAAAQRGWLYENNGAFGLTEPGREVIEGMYELGDRLQTKVKALTNPEMERLLSLSDRVIVTIKELSEPARKPAFNLSLLFNRSLSKSSIVQTRQRMLILLALRDDAHIAAWRPLEPDGQLWEVFTLIWREQAASAAELVDQLPHRNYAESDYAAALEKLSVRGWITVQGDRYIPKEEAVRIRQEVEDTTDQIFNAAFADLSIAEMNEFQRLMEKFAIAVGEPEKIAT